MDLLFVVAQWHGLAKLRLHTDDTLIHLDKLTTDLGEQLRKFKKRTCAVFETKELPREILARDNKKNKSSANKRGKKPSTKPHKKPPTKPPKKSSTKPPSERRKPRKKEFRLNTYKNHALGHYVEIIRRYGTTDSYSTESVCVFLPTPDQRADNLQGELEHRTPKARYKRTSKKFFIRQITQIERREHRLRRIRAHNNPSYGHDRDTSEAISPDMHHHIGKSQNEAEHIGTFLSTNAGDPAVKVVF